MIETKETAGDTVIEIPPVQDTQIAKNKIEVKTCCQDVHCDCCVSCGKGFLKGLEYTGRGIGSVLGGTLGAAGGAIAGVGVFLYCIFPIKCGCEGIYGLDIRIYPCLPITYLAIGAKKGFMLFWK